MAIYDELIKLTGITTDSHLLEIGCATGKATLPLARRGFRITAVELGAELAHVARTNLAPYPLVTVYQDSFETWQSPAASRYDLVFAATAWHWLDLDLRYHRAYAVLRPGGYLAFWGATHVFPDGGDPFFADVQDVYEEVGESKPGDNARPRPGELPNQEVEIVASGLFDIVEVREFDWEVDYTADEYLDLLNTFSNHLAMPEHRRDRLYTEIRSRILERPSGTVRRGWGAVLHLVRRRDRPARPH
jgi:SAM-dependent methyltransferase